MSDSRTDHSVEFSNDPHQWLEEVTGARALDWVRERNAECATTLGEGARIAALEQRLLAILDSEQRIPFVGKHGAHYYNFWRDREHERGVLRRTTLEEYKKDEPEWQSVLDLDALARIEGDNWQWGGESWLEPEADRCLIHLSLAGSDAVVVREFDVERCAFVADGFVIPEAKSRVSWIDRDTIFVGSDFGSGSLTASGFPRIVKRWRRGTPLVDAEIVFEASVDDVSVTAWHDPTEGFERDLLFRSLTFYTSEVYLIRGEQLTRIDKPDDADVSFHCEWLLLRLRSEYSAMGRSYPAGSLLGIEFDAFLEGSRQFQTLFEPTERTVLRGFARTQNHLVLSLLDEVRSRLSVLRRGEHVLVPVELPGIPSGATLGAWGVDANRSDDFFLVTTDYLTPTQLHLGTLGRAPPTLLKGSPEYFSAKGLQVRQFHARSADGTRVPYFRVAKQELALDGRNPTLLYGYGGFEISLLPSYNAEVGAAWLEQGGVYVVANIRGGGEFGPRWHQAALKANRPRAFEDFIAVAEDLIAQGVTSPEHLGCEGGSNGGLLVGNMLTLRPELFGAIVCSVPLLDMRRYPLLLVGPAWKAEYGDPDDPAEWQWLREISPYHNLERGRRYPPLLLLTSTRDDRVHPGHARKMVARMLEYGIPNVTYYENIEGGHGGAANNRQFAHKAALKYEFLRRWLG